MKPASLHFGVFTDVHPGGWWDAVHPMLPAVTLGIWERMKASRLGETGSGHTCPQPLPALGCLAAPLPQSLRGTGPCSQCLAPAPASGAQSQVVKPELPTLGQGQPGVLFLITACDPQISLGTGNRGRRALPVMAWSQSPDLLGPPSPERLSWGSPYGRSLAKSKGPGLGTCGPQRWAGPWWQVVHRLRDSSSGL